MEKTEEEFRKEIDDIIAHSSSADEVLKKVNEAYPELTIDSLKAQYEKEAKKAEEAFTKRTDSETVENLSEEELETVAGGSFSSWMKKNWPYVVGAAIILTAVGTSIYFGTKGSYQKSFESGRRAGSEKMTSDILKEGGPEKFMK